MKPLPNTPRSAAYIKLKHCIFSCENVIQLETLRKPVLTYEAHNEDGRELIALWFEKHEHLSPTENPHIEPLYKLKTL